MPAEPRTCAAGNPCNVANIALFFGLYLASDDAKLIR